MPIWGASFCGCEIKNDTHVDMYIARKIDWGAVSKTALIIGSGVALLSGVGGLVGLGAAAATEGAATAAAGTAAAAAGTAAVTAGIALSVTDVWTIVGLVGGGAGLLGTLFGLSPAETDELKHDLSVAPDGADVIVHTDKSIMQIVEGNSDKNLAKAMNMTESQVRQMKKVITDHKHGATRVAPGKSFKFDTGVYSTWKAHVITENLEEGVADVRTAFWYGKYSHYKASTLWKNISSKKKPIAIHKGEA